MLPRDTERAVLMKRRPLALKLNVMKTSETGSGEALEARAGAFYKMALHPFPALLWYPLRSQVLLKTFHR